LLLSGATKKLLHSLEHEMKKASQRREYERAAQVRDTIRALTGTIKAHARNINIYKRMASHLAQGVEELQEKLELPYSPNTIEAIDISNITGVCAVGSVVVFKQGRPYKKGYRRYQIREVEGIDDYSMIREVVRRRYAIAQDDKKDMPDFVFIDGGKGHLQAALKEARKHSINPVLFMSIAKRNEEIFVPKRKTPICLERGSSSLLLVQHVRDEAHRFALQYHRKLRRKRIKESILDDISGVGEKRKRNLLSRFGSIDALKGKTACEIAEAPSIDMNLARVIYEYIHKGVTK